MAIDPRQIELSSEMKQAIADQAERSGKSWVEVLWDAIQSHRAGRRQPPANAEGETF